MKDEIFCGIEHAEEIRSFLLNTPLRGVGCDRVEQFLRHDFRAVRIKANAKRKVFCLSLSSGESFYLKLYSQQRFPLNFLRFYPAKEYAVARELEQHGVPVVSYLAWGRISGSGGFCLSAGVPDAVSARRFFFETACPDEAKKSSFLNHLAELTGRLYREKYYHPDYHTGNILCAEQGEKVLLVDPWGIRKGCDSEKLRLSLCMPWAELRCCLTAEQITEGILHAGLVKERTAAVHLMQRTAAAYDAHFNHRWERVTQYRILRGDPKFCTVQNSPDGIYHWHNTPWYSAPEVMQLNPAWRKQVFASAEESENLWLDSFRQPYFENPPVVRVLRPDGSSELYYRF